MEKKKRNLIIGVAAVVLVVVLCLVCCRKSSDKYCSAIPSDAVGLVRLDAAGFIKKHNIDLDGLKSLMGPMDGMLDNSGIDLEKPIYAFATPKGSLGFVAKMKSTEDLKTLVKSVGRMMGAKLSEKQGYNWIDMGDILVCFDANKLLGLSNAGMNARKDMIALMEQDEDESVMGTKLFESVGKIEQPFAILTNINTILDAAGPEGQMALAQSAKLYDLEPEDMDMNFTLTFDVVKDKAVLAFNYDPLSSALKNKMDEFAKMFTPNTGKFINTISDDPLVWGCAHLEGDKFGKMIEDAIETQLSSASNSTEMIALHAIKDAFLKVIESFNGDINFVMPSLDEPNFLVQADVKNNEILSLIEMAGKESQGIVPVMKAGENSYTIALDNNVILAGVKNNSFYLSNSTDMTAKLGKEVDSRIENLKKDICNSYFYLTVDAQSLIGLLMQQSDLKMLMASFIGRLTQLDRLTLRNTSAYGVELTLSVKDGKDFIETLFN